MKQKESKRENILWWEEIGRCKAITKSGKRCKLPARRPYELKGRLFIPLTCHKHKHLEGEIRRKLGISDIILGFDEK